MAHLITLKGAKREGVTKDKTRSPSPSEQNVCPNVFTESKKGLKVQAKLMTCLVKPYKLFLRTLLYL